MKLNIQPLSITTSGVNVLNGAFTSLAGPIGFTPVQPQIRVTQILLSSINGGGIELFKGASGATAAGTQVFVCAPPSDWIAFDVDIVLDAADFLVAKAIGDGAVLGIAATINF